MDKNEELATVVEGIAAQRETNNEVELLQNILQLGIAYLRFKYASRIDAETMGRIRELAGVSGAKEHDHVGKT